MKRIKKEYKNRKINKNVGSYVLIERSSEKHEYGEKILLGNAKYISQKSKIDFAQPKVIYFEKDIEGQVKIDDCLYDVVYYYNVIINFQTIQQEISNFNGLSTI